MHVIVMFGPSEHAVLCLTHALKERLQDKNIVLVDPSKHLEARKEESNKAEMQKDNNLNKTGAAYFLNIDSIKKELDSIEKANAHVLIAGRFILDDLAIKALELQNSCKIYVDTDPDSCLAHFLMWNRDKKTQVDKTLEEYEQQISPVNKKIELAKKVANIHIPINLLDGDKLKPSVELICSWIPSAKEDAFREIVREIVSNVVKTQIANRRPGWPNFYSSAKSHMQNTAEHLDNSDVSEAATL